MTGNIGNIEGERSNRVDRWVIWPLQVPKDPGKAEEWEAKLQKKKEATWKTNLSWADGSSSSNGITKAAAKRLCVRHDEVS